MKTLLGALKKNNEAPAKGQKNEQIKYPHRRELENEWPWS